MRQVCVRRTVFVDQLPPGLSGQDHSTQDCKRGDDRRDARDATRATANEPAHREERRHHRKLDKVLRALRMLLDQILGDDFFDALLLVFSRLLGHPSRARDQGRGEDHRGPGASRQPAARRGERDAERNPGQQCREDNGEVNNHRMQGVGQGRHGSSIERCVGRGKRIR